MILSKMIGHIKASKVKDEDKNKYNKLMCFRIMISYMTKFKDLKNIECYLQVYLDNFTYIIVEKEMTDYLDDNLFESD